MDKTLGYILCCQSPALFLAAVVLLICYFARQKKHKVRAIMDLILAILMAATGVIMYFMGMRMEFFTIHDFYQLRTSGIVGLIVVAAVSVYTAVRTFLRYSKRRREEKEAIRAENARKNTEIIAASIRTPMHVTQCAMNGADISTIPFKVLKMMFKHPLTDSGIEKFKADWATL